MMIVPDAANMPPTPWQTEILAPGIWAGATPRIWRTLSAWQWVIVAPAEAGVQGGTAETLAALDSRFSRE